MAVRWLENNAQFDGLEETGTPPLLAGLFIGLVVGPLGREAREGGVERRRDCESERRASAGVGFYPDAAAVALYYFLAERQADAGAGDFVAVQALEHVEDLPGVFSVHADAVVLHRE